MRSVGWGEPMGCQPAIGFLSLVSSTIMSSNLPSVLLVDRREAFDQLRTEDIVEQVGQLLLLLADPVRSSAGYNPTKRSLIFPSGALTIFIRLSVSMSFNRPPSDERLGEIRRRLGRMLD